MVSDQGTFQACYWKDAGAIGGDPDLTEFSNLLTELKRRIQVALRARDFAYAAIFREEGGAWELVEEFAVRD
jgi:hypothetical protein